MHYFYFFIVLIILSLIPALICIVYEVVDSRRLWKKGITLTKVLSSYGIYSIFLAISTISGPIRAYIQEKCAHTVEEVAPCNSFIALVASILESWLFAIMLVVALIAQLMYLRFIAKYITFNKALHRTSW